MRDVLVNVLLVSLVSTACNASGAGEEANVDATGAVADASTPDATAGITADALRARIAGCADIIGGPYALDDDGRASVSICGLPDALTWTADLDVDCDGAMSAQCNVDQDPDYLPETATTDSHGGPLDAATLPYVVVPSPSVRFDYRDTPLRLGDVIAVIYGDRVVYGVFGDTGPTAIIGEASYAMAAALGIDPDPSTGGTDEPVAYIAFPGERVMPIEDHSAAVAIGEARAAALIAAP